MKKTNGILMYLSYVLLLLLITAERTLAVEANFVKKGISRVYPQKFTDWEEGFLSGNGEMGIIVFGNPLNETVENLDWNIPAKSVNCILKSDIEQDIILIERRGIQSIKTTVTVNPSPYGGIARIIHLSKNKNVSISITTD
ncbi:hypothetical protein EZS27_011287 [termite gut metagenome]|uniref:Uncharacterized protein n=1 Tax=termite gut metagenome TaxID=433724 RepID=A0A5J4S4D0_9ZZZZ